GIGVVLLLGGRAIMDGADYLRGASLAAEIEALAGAPSNEDLMTRTTEAAGCLYGIQPPVRTCWYAWAEPERPDFLAIIAQRVMDDSGGSALAYALGALPFASMVMLAGWKATRAPQVLRPSLLAKQRAVKPTPTPGRLAR
ncbi:MAG: hypothetical protein AB1Z66_00760, partial [Candidatus Limnocylindrales bacterium]